MQTDGKIIKGIAGFYYVEAANTSDVYECKAKGSFRKEGTKPLVGDFVAIDVIDKEKKLGNIIEIKKRKNTLIRPNVANIDQALVIFALTNPQPNFHLLDVFLARMELLDIPCIICFNKADLDQDGLLQKEVTDIYSKTPYPILFTSTKEKKGIEEIKEVLTGKCSTVAGPSGVGKSSLINLIKGDVIMETGGLSEKTSRGKHTTRHSELITLGKDSYILDTPGFTSLGMEEYEKEDIAKGFAEIYQYEGQCRFVGCSHVHEPDCKVKEELALGNIGQKRYDSYVMLYQERLNKKKRY